MPATLLQTTGILWLYPAKVDDAVPADVLISSRFDDQTAARLAAGGKVLLLTTKLSHENPRGSFTPIFWNRYMFNSQACTTLGLLCDPQHPAVRQFPTDFHSDWEWEDIVKNSRCFVMDSLPRELRPIVQYIDDWNMNRKLGLIWECRVGQGKLLVCTADLQNNLETRPAARQLRASLLHYMAGADFDPKVSVGSVDLDRLMQKAKPSNMVVLGAKVISVDSEDRAHGNIAAHAIDGDPDTFWHTRWQPNNDPLPHQLVIDLGRTLTLKGITYLPRQDMANGRIAACEIFCSNDPQSWSEPVAQARWSNSGERETVRFRQPVQARYVKVRATREVNQNPFIAIAELDVITDAP